MINNQMVKLLAKQEKSLVRLAQKEGTNLKKASVIPQKVASDVVEISQKTKTSVEQAVKDYFAATNNDAKEKAYNIIDRYIQKIAKKEFISSGESSFEDHLQNVRLRFWRIINKRKEKGVNVSRDITATMVQGQPNAQIRAKIKTSPNMEKYAEDFSCTDLSTETFEKNDLINYLLNSLKKERSSVILGRLINGDDPNSIAEMFDLTRQRVIEIAKKAGDEFKERYRLIHSNEFLTERSNIGLNAERNPVIKH
jgi:hypothetical protein